MTSYNVSSSQGGTLLPVGITLQPDGTYSLGNVGRAASLVSPVAQPTTNSYANIGAAIDTIFAALVSFTIVNSGANTLTWQVLGGNAADLSDAQVVQAGADVAAAGISSYSGSAVWRYYVVQAKSKVNGSAGTALVRGITKG